MYCKSTILCISNQLINCWLSMRFNSMHQNIIYFLFGLYPCTFSNCICSKLNVSWLDIFQVANVLFHLVAWIEADNKVTLLLSFNYIISWSCITYIPIHLPPIRSNGNLIYLFVNIPCFFIYNVCIDQTYDQHCFHSTIHATHHSLKNDILCTWSCHQYGFGIW